MKRLMVVIFSLVLMFSLVVLPSPVHAATYTVTNTNDSGSGSLREAILNANANSGLDIIDFDISGTGPHTIQPLSALPTISDPVIIDGYTQLGASPNTNPTGTGLNTVLMIELDGSLLAGTPQGLYITSNDCTLRGLVINRFSGNGIFLLNNSGNHIEGNFIGTNVIGTTDLGNGTSGVFLQNSMGNTIGGATSAKRNLISGNTANGITITGNQATGNVVQGNLIGTDYSGMVNLGNGYDGVGIIYGSNNIVGGTTQDAGNVICSNSYAGVEIQQQNAKENVVQGNLIGTDITGTNKLGNGQGVVIGGAQDNIIGGTIAGAGNVISGNFGNGVAFYGSEAIGNFVQGNFIGTDISGTIDLGNSGDGVNIESGSSNIIGGITTGAGNIISGNYGRGVCISIGNKNLVQGNFIGTDFTGTTDLGNSGDGVHMWAAPSNMIGGTTIGAGNVISSNGRDGVVISHPSATSNLVQGNFIGTDVTGTVNMGNSINGVWIIDAHNNTIGGSAAIAGNTIAFNAGEGVLIESGNNNHILSNSIFSNMGLGIDLGADGVTLNDPGDDDTGANNLQNFPFLTSATSGSSITIEGTLNSTPNIEFRLEFFSNTAFDPTGYGEGENFLGYTDVTTDGSGDVSFSATLSDTVPIGYFISATATDSNNNTSEFSQCVQVTAVTVEATVDFDPNTLNLKSKGRWITCHIRLPEGYDIHDIDISTVMLNETVPAEWGNVQDGTMMVKFKRSDVQDILEPGNEVEVTISGELADGTLFEGTDTIRVIQKGKSK